MSRYRPQPHEARARFIAGSLELIQRRDGCTLAEAEETAIGEWERWMDWHNTRVQRGTNVEYGWAGDSQAGTFYDSKEEAEEFMADPKLYYRSKAGEWTEFK